MIDFSGVKAITIPEGSVSKITRNSDGAILWEKISMVTVTVVSMPEMMGGCNVYVGGNGLNYAGASCTVPKGTFASIEGNGSLYWNNILVHSFGRPPEPYDFVLENSIEIYFDDIGRCYVTEV